MRKDLRWWKETAYRFNRHSFPFLVRMKPEINLAVTSDASDIGFGARFGNRWFAYRWLFRETDRFHIAYRDLFAVVCALATWGAEYRGKVVNFWCESSAEERYLEEEGHPRATRTISTTPAAKATHRARSDGEAQRRAPRATIALEAKWDHRKRNALARKGNRAREPRSDHKAAELQRTSDADSQDGYLSAMRAWQTFHAIHSTESPLHAVQINSESPTPGRIAAFAVSGDHNHGIKTDSIRKISAVYEFY